MLDAEPAPPQKKGIPPWVMTFADLMTLLMCFFVLLLSFSEMDVAKFKQLSGSMKEAFGVQTEVKVKSIPKGTSVVAQEFSPGKPEPTLMNEVRQFTVDSNRNSLDAIQSELKEIAEARAHARRLRAALKDEIERGSVSIRTDGLKIVVHIMENASFESGLAEVRPQFMPVLTKIAMLIDNNSGQVIISGHTDNIPIHNDEFRSNWELSTSRAVSVTHVILQEAGIEPQRITVSGHADTKPLASNDTASGRAQNRRVDISIERGRELDRDRDITILGREAVANQTATTNSSSANVAP